MVCSVAEAGREDRKRDVYGNEFKMKIRHKGS